MSDYDRTLELQASAYNSVGQSTIQFNKYQDTVEYKINQIKNSWERLRVSLLNQDVYKGALNIGNQLLSSIKEDFSLKDLAFIGIIGLTIGKTFVTQMIKGIQTNTNTMFATIQSQMSNIANKTKLAISKIQIGDKTIRIPVHIDTTQMKQEITDTSTQIKNQLSLLSSDIQKDLLTINNQPINLTGLAEFNQMLSAGKTTAELSNEAIIKLYQQMGQTGTITAGTQSFNNFRTQLELIETELLKTSGNENLTALQASELRDKLQQLATQTQQLTKAQEANAYSTSKMGKTFSAIGSAIGQNLGIGITSGITTYLATGDLEQSLKVGMTSIITSVISTYLPKLITLLFSNPISAITTVIAAAGIGIGTMVYNNLKKDVKSQKELLLDEISDINDEIENLQEKVDTSTSTAKADKQTITNMEELKEEWDNLNHKISLSSEEQERYNELVQQINDEYPETIAYYNEMTNALTINEQLWSQQLEEAREIAALSANTAYHTQMQENSLENQKALNENELSLLKTKETQGYATKLSTDATITYQNLSQEMGTYEHQAIDDVIESGLIDYQAITDLITKNYQDAISYGYVSAEDNKASLINAQLANIKSYYDKEQPNTVIDYNLILKLLNNNDQQMIDFYQNTVLPFVGENDEVIKVIEEANNTIKDASELYDKNTQEINKNTIEQQKQIIQSNLSETIGSTEAQMVISTKTGEQLIKESATKDATNVNEYIKSIKGLESYSSTQVAVDKFFSYKDFEQAIQALNISAEEAQNMFGVTSDTYTDKNKKTAIDALNSYVLDEYAINSLEAAANKLPQALIDSMTELNEQATNMSISEYQQVIDKLKNQYTNNIENIESGADNSYQNFANMFITQNNEGQITGGIFSNLFKNEDIASQFAEAIQNGDFSTAQQLLIDNLGDDGKLFADILMNVDPTTISSISSFIADNFTGDEAQAKAQAGFQELLKKMTTGSIDLKDNELSILLNSGIDFSTNNPLTNDTLKKQAAEALYNASAGALSYEQALQKVNNVYSDLIKIAGEFQYGSESAFNTLISSSQAASEELKNQSDVLFTILDDYNTATGLTREQINQLNEVGLQDIYKLSQDTGTIMLDLSKVTETFSNNTEKTAEALKKELAVEKENITLLEQQRKNMEALGKDTVEITKQINEANKSYQDHTLKTQQEISLSYQESISYLQKYVDWLKDLQDAADEAQEALKKAQEEQQKAQKELDDIRADLPNKIAEAYKEEAEAIKEAQEAAEDAYESLQDAYDALQDAQETLADANKELYEAIHGTEDYTTGLDRMYNASRRIDTIDKRLENLKETMENATNSDDIVRATEDYINMAKEKVNVLTAMNQADQQTLNNMMNDFLNNSSYDALKQFFRQTENGIEIDMQGIENADANDEIKNAAIEWAEQYNEIFDNILDRNDEISEAQKIMEDYYKTALDGYVSLQEKVADILKENAEEEISITEEKYASMKEADDAYLDALESAINKQRELREQANQYENLATQEKKLALLSRDTSGANQKQVLELQQEVETSRTEILDAEIDNFLESMRELYETQQEARDAEIEYLNALMESTNWWTKTNEILNSFENADDYKAWLMENDTSFGDMSVEQQEQYLMEAETDYNAIPQFDAAKIMMEQWGQDLSVMIQADVDEVNRIVNELGIDTAIGDQILTAGEVARDEMIRTAEESVASAEQAVAEAQQNVLDMEVAYQEAMDNITTVTQEAAEERENAIQEAYQEEEDAAQALKEANDTLRDAEIEATTAANNLQNALGNTATTATEAIANINNSIATLQNDCVRYIQDLTNGNLSEASNRYYISTHDLGAVNTSTKIQDVFGVDIPEENVLTGAEADNFIAQYGQWFHEAGYDLTVNRYAQGGMVDYTGPAWVDGSKSKPEAFLDPEDTQNIAELTAVLSSQKSSSVPFTREMISAASSFGNILYPALNSIPASSNISNISTTTNNNSTATSTNVEVHINVDSISSDYDVEQMLNVVEQRIYEVANPVGSSVILQK